MSLCICRTCKKKYDGNKARGDWRGFCSNKCQHEKAKELGWSPAKEKSGKCRPEYKILKGAGEIGDVPVPAPEARKVYIPAHIQSMEQTAFNAIDNLIQETKHFIAAADVLEPKDDLAERLGYYHAALIAMKKCNNR